MRIQSYGLYLLRFHTYHGHRWTESRCDRLRLMTQQCRVRRLWRRLECIVSSRFNGSAHHRLRLRLLLYSGWRARCRLGGCRDLHAGRTLHERSGCRRRGWHDGGLLLRRLLQSLTLSEREREHMR